MDHPFSGILVRYVLRPPLAASNAGASNADLPKKELPVSPDFTDELHVNLWEVRNPSVLDIGIMIGKWQDIESVIVDLPWEVAQDHVEDLGSRLNSEKTVAAIFNEIVRYNGSADQLYAQITFRPIDVESDPRGNNQNARSFTLLRLPGRNYSIERIRLGQGVFSSQLRIKLPERGTLVPESTDPLYLRFRIDKVPQSVYSSSFALADRNLLSSSTTTRIIDFRINVRRGIPDEILAGHYLFRFPRLKKIHFFLTIDRTQVCNFESQNFVGCRSLVDEKIWNEYLHTTPYEQKAEAMKRFLGYQWTAASKIDSAGFLEGVKDLVVLGRFSSHVSNIAKTLRFVFLGLLFGMVGNGLWDVFKPIKGEYLANLADQHLALFVLLLLLVISLICVWPWSRAWFENRIRQRR